MGASKGSISKFLIGNRFHVKLRILSPYSNRTFIFTSDVILLRENPLGRHYERRKDFSSRGNSGFFQAVAKSIFSRGETMVKFHFANSKLTGTHFSTKNEQIQKLGRKAHLHPPPTPVVVTINCEHPSLCSRATSLVAMKTSPQFTLLC